jgi:hypothetical protein
MNRLFVLLSALLTCGMLSAQEARQLAHRKIHIMHSRVESHQKEKDNLSYTTVRYDRKGRESTVFEFNADSVCIQAEFFEYNKNGKLTLHTTIDSLTHSRSRLEQRYDNRNLLQEKILLIDGKQKERTVYTYNTLDDRTFEQVYDESNTLKKETRFIYDFRGMLLRKTTTDINGKIIYDKINHYEY